MTSQIDISKDNKVDTDLLGLVLIARYHQIPIDQETLRHEYCPAVKKIGETSFFGDQEILIATKSLADLFNKNSKKHCFINILKSVW
jgi:hypothetical protein